MLTKSVGHGSTNSNLTANSPFIGCALKLTGALDSGFVHPGSCITIVPGTVCVWQMHALMSVSV